MVSVRAAEVFKRLSGLCIIAHKEFMGNESTNGNGRVNPLDTIFGNDDELIRVSINHSRTGEPTGVVGVFKPISPNVKANYDRIVQKGFGGRKPMYDDGDKYVFPKIIQEIEGLTVEDCGGLDPVQFCQKTPKGGQLLKVLMNGYWTLTLPSTDE